MTERRPLVIGSSSAVELAPGDTIPAYARARTTAQMDADAGNSALEPGRVYLVSDTSQIAIATSASAYTLYSRVGTASTDAMAGDRITSGYKIAVVASLPGSPDPNTVYIVTS